MAVEYRVVRRRRGWAVVAFQNLALTAFGVSRPATREVAAGEIAKGSLPMCAACFSPMYAVGATQKDA